MLWLQNNLFFSFAGLTVFFILIWSVFLQIQLLALKKRWKRVFDGGQAADLEEMISRQNKCSRKNEKELAEIRKFTLYLEKMAISGLQKSSVVRFNPFKDAGGNQSFVLCLLDGQHTGVILSSLFTRDGNRVFAKPIREGKSEFPLTAEEVKALEKATKNKK